MIHVPYLCGQQCPRKVILIMIIKSNRCIALFSVMIIKSNCCIALFTVMIIKSNCCIVLFSVMIIKSNCCIALFSVVHKLTALYNIKVQHQNSTGKWWNVRGCITLRLKVKQAKVHTSKQCTRKEHSWAVQQVKNGWNKYSHDIK